MGDSCWIARVQTSVEDPLIQRNNLAFHIYVTSFTILVRNKGPSFNCSHTVFTIVMFHLCIDHIINLFGWLSFLGHLLFVCNFFLFYFLLLLQFKARIYVLFEAKVISPFFHTFLITSFTFTFITVWSV